MSFVCLATISKPGSRHQKVSKRLRPLVDRDPALDVAVHYGYLDEQADHVILDRELAITSAVAEKLQVGVGDAIFIAGLFGNYTGDDVNVPILRVGNLAAYPAVRVTSKGVKMDAFLIEATSVGGLSGSPVFYHSHASSAGILRPSYPEMLSALKDQSFYLMGIVHAHFTRSENKGIAIVVPISGILDFIDNELLPPGNQSVRDQSSSE